ncbi:hypothetical protein L195_g019135 [Trifolium pratense]|uniref:Uncharacterized protein n=1 Tax=Trifolium pratense TaxID=57577 RepID=A0A2K3MYV1_TRIPR|nr:hypothetical protein L195_g019135 [Trifolium pratense]
MTFFMLGCRLGCNLSLLLFSPEIQQVKQFPDAERKDNDEMKLNLMDLKMKNYLFQENDATVLDTILKQGVSKNENGENTDGNVGETVGRTEDIREEDSSSEGGKRARELRPPQGTASYMDG